ncbi:MAG: hypothetical protein A2X36_03345 [Elusimicrobia bacterium GWA2_69_24]|nr:MAG: hypothetical protein A2X36_03345 [Elusimicrobia bacterium GWA2_69_24]
MGEPAPKPAPEDSDAVLVETGAFRVDRSRALDKIMRFQLPDPGMFLLPWVRAAVASGATAVWFRRVSGGIELRCDGRPWTRKELSDPYRHLFEAEADSERGRHLAVGLLGALRLKPRRITVVSGAGAARTALATRSLAEETLSERREPGEKNTVLTVEWGGWPARPPSPDPASYLMDRCGLSPIPIWVDEREVPRLGPAGDPYGLYFEEELARGWLSVPHLPAPATRLEAYTLGVYINDGLEFTLPKVQTLGGIHCDAFRLNASQSGVVRDETFDRVRELAARRSLELLDKAAARHTLDFPLAVRLILDGGLDSLWRRMVGGDEAGAAAPRMWRRALWAVSGVDAGVRADLLERLRRSARVTAWLREACTRLLPAAGPEPDDPILLRLRATPLHFDSDGQTFSWARLQELGLSPKGDPLSSPAKGTSWAGGPASRSLRELAAAGRRFTEAAAIGVALDIAREPGFLRSSRIDPDTVLVAEDGRASLAESTPAGTAAAEGASAALGKALFFLLTRKESGKGTPPSASALAAELGISKPFAAVLSRMLRGQTPDQAPKRLRRELSAALSGRLPGPVLAQRLAATALSLAAFLVLSSFLYRAWQDRGWNLPDRVLPAQENHSPALSFSPDGGLLASGEKNKVRVWNTRSWTEVAVLDIPVFSHHPTGFVEALAFRPDGKSIAVGATHWADDKSAVSSVRVLELAAKRVLFQSGIWSGALSGLDFSPDGGLLALSTNEWDQAGQRYREGRAWIVDLDGGAIRHNFARGGAPIRTLRFTSDGKLLYGAPTKLFLHDWLDGEPDRAVADGPEQVGSSPFSFHPERNLIAIPSQWNEYVGVRGMDGRLVAHLNLEIQKLEYRSFTPGAFSGDGRRYAAPLTLRGLRGVVVWETAYWMPIRRLRCRPPMINPVVWSVALNRDGTLLAACVGNDRDSRVHLWELPK